MVVMNEEKYLERKVTKNGMRDWWFPVYNAKGQLTITLNQVVLSKEFEGKKLRFRLEVLDEEEQKLIFVKDGKKDQETIKERGQI